jgi:replicative DNA helicase
VIGGEGAKLREYFARPIPEKFALGFRELDASLDGGVRAGESTMVGGFSSHAKSAFAEQVALYVSTSTPTLYVPLELGADLQRLRMAAKLARCSLGVMQRTGCDPITAAELTSRQLTIYAPKRRTIGEIEKLVARQAHKLVIIDDCRNIDGVIYSGGRSEAHAIAARITEIAQYYGVHLLALQQLDAKTFRNGPSEWRFADSSVFEQRAYNMLTIFRPYRQRGAREDVVAEIRIRKNRWGPAGKLHYRWQGDSMSFWEFSEHELDNLECCATMKARKREALKRDGRA